MKSFHVDIRWFDSTTTITLKNATFRDLARVVTLLNSMSEEATGDHGGLGKAMFAELEETYGVHLKHAKKGATP